MTRLLNNIAYTLRKSLSRKKAEVYVKTDTMEYLGRSRDVIGLLSDDELDMLVRYEELTHNGSDRQWNIFVNKVD